MVDSKEVLSETTPMISLVRTQLVREEGSYGKVSTPENAADIAGRFLPEGTDREHFFSLLMNTRGLIHAVNLISIGTVNMAPVHPREVFKPAILTNSASLIVVHNHPSGDVAPSREDAGVTRRLVAAGQLLGIEVLDHIILGDGYYSFSEHGEL